MTKLLTLTFSIIVSFYAGQALASDGKPCPYNKDRHAKVSAKKTVLVALNKSKSSTVRSSRKSSKVQ